MTNTGEPSMLKAAAKAAGIGTVLVSIPYVSSCCCIWVPMAGAMSVYFYKGDGGQASVGAGAKSGFLTGLLMGLFATLVTVAFVSIMGVDHVFDQAKEQVAQQFEQVKKQNPQADIEEMEEAIYNGIDMVKRNFWPFMLLQWLAGSLMYGFFCLFGGLVAGSVLEQREDDPDDFDK